MPNMKDLSLKVKKLWPMLKFFDGQTDGQSDYYRAGGALRSYKLI